MFVNKIIFPDIEGNSRSYPVNVISKLGKTEFNIKSPVTLIYGSNGSGKSTLLNIISHKLNCDRETKIDPKVTYDYRIGRAISLFDEVSQKTDIVTSNTFDYDDKGQPENQRLITSAEVLNYIARKVDHNNKVSVAINTKVNRINSWKWGESDGSISEGSANLKKITERDTSARISMHEKNIQSNGEEIFEYFAEILESNSLYLLDEPENCLSPIFQQRLAECITDLAYEYNSQFIIASHSPFFLSIEGAQIINIDAYPAECCDDWRKLENMRPYFELFGDIKG